MAAIGNLLDRGALSTLTPALAEIGDVERIATRIALASARPRDLAALRDALLTLPRLSSLVGALEASLLRQLYAGIQANPELADLLTRAIQPVPSALLRDVDVIAPGL